MSVRLRYFAAVAEAAGTHEEDVELRAGATVGDLKDALIAKYGDAFAKQLAISALLVDGVRSEDDDPLSDRARVDVLPPFAGG